MRGPNPITFPVPTRGLVANVPPHQLPPDSLAVGSFNVFVDLDGNLKTRSGYAPVPPDGSGLNPNDYPIGLINFHNAADFKFYTVMQGINTWQYFNGTDWNNITNSLFPTTGSFGLPGQFTVLFQGAQSVVYGVNGVNTMRSWFPTQAVYQNVPAAPISRDLDVIANRIVTIFTTEGATHYPYRVRWSAINDGTTWPALAFADLQGASHDMDYIVAIKALNRLNAAIYRENSIWVMTAVPGTDASAFSFEVAANATGIAGPVNAASIVAFNGIHYYLGTDNRVWTFDSVNAYPISSVVDSYFIPNINSSVNFRSSAAYLPQKKQIWFFFTPVAPVIAPGPKL